MSAMALSAQPQETLNFAQYIFFFFVVGIFAVLYLAPREESSRLCMCLFGYFNIFISHVLKRKC